MAQNKIILVIAPKGAGKTRTVSQLVDKLDRVAVFDMVKDEQYTSNKKEMVVIEGRPRDFGNAIGVSNEPDNTKRFYVVYHPKRIEPQDNGLLNSEELGIIVKACHEWRGHMYLVIDEAHLFCNSYNCPKDLMMATLIGRHKEFSMILVAQSFTGIHPAIRRNADEIYFWKIIEPAELDGVKERCGKEVMLQVSELRAVEVDENDKFKAPGQRLHWTKFGGVVEVTE